LRQLFPKVTPFYRPQESVFTTGQEKILKECGVDGLMLYYALVPFNTLGVFTPALSQERRYNPFWFRSREDQPPLILFPAMSAADVIEKNSLEVMMLDLHARQQRGEIQSDVVIHLNEDADLESWLPLDLPKFMKWMPNTRGLNEYIDLVNKYPWADFTVPSEYLAGHPPQGEVLVRQDLADGGFDGSYSWAEKCASLRTWTVLEQSRLATYRAEALAKRAGLDLRDLLWEGMDSSFFKRLIGLSTTHFGMSTPVINEERQARAFAILGESRQIAHQAERKAAGRVVRRTYQDHAPDNILYEFELLPTPPDRDAEPASARVAVNVPIILPEGICNVKVIGTEGKSIRASVTDPVRFSDGRTGFQLRFVTDNFHNLYRVIPEPWHKSHAPVRVLENKWLRIEFSGETGIRSFKYNGAEIGGTDFLQPFVTYRTKGKPVVYLATAWEQQLIDLDSWDGLERVRMKAGVPMQTPYGEFLSEFFYTFNLFDDLPYLYVDVEARFAATPATETIHNMTQKLRRLMDLRWIEVAPFQLRPLLEAPAAKPLRVWKHNYLGITAYYDLNYGQINSHNRNLDSFNHQVTAGWVAVSNGKRGLLLGENAEALTSMAFCPMRLREQNGIQQLWLNPFGSYYGEQASYSHLGATGLGADFLKAFSGFLKPNGPSYNGQTLHFTLMLAPYSDDEPQADLQAEAAAHFYPPEVIFHAVPKGMDAILPADIRTAVEAELREAAIAATRTVPAPTAFLANPSLTQANLVWDAPRDVPVTGYEVAWRASEETEWHTETIPPSNRWQLSDLKDGQEYVFKLRSACGSRLSDWTQEQTCVPGAVTGSNVGGGFALLPMRALVKLVTGSLWSVFRSIIKR
jgi:hypothetical protein